MFETKPDNFDENYRFLTNLTLKDVKEHLDDEIDGRLWVREMLLNTQVHGPQEPKKTIIICSLLTAVSWTISDYIYY